MRKRALRQAGGPFGFVKRVNGSFERFSLAILKPSLQTAPTPTADEGLGFSQLGALFRPRFSGMGTPEKNEQIQTFNRTWSQRFSSPRPCAQQFTAFLTFAGTRQGPVIKNNGQSVDVFSSFWRWNSLSWALMSFPWGEARSRFEGKLCSLYFFPSGWGPVMKTNPEEFPFFPRAKGSELLLVPNPEYREGRSCFGPVMGDGFRSAAGITPKKRARLLGRDSGRSALGGTFWGRGSESLCSQGTASVGSHGRGPRRKSMAPRFLIKRFQDGVLFSNIRQSRTFLRKNFKRSGLENFPAELRWRRLRGPDSNSLFGIFPPKRFLFPLARLIPKAG